MKTNFLDMKLCLDMMKISHSTLHLHYSCFRTRFPSEKVIEMLPSAGFVRKRGLGSTTSHASQKQLQCSGLSPQHIRLSCPRHQGDGSTSTQKQTGAINPKKTGQIHNHHWDGVHRQTDQVSSNRLKRQYFLVYCTNTHTHTQNPNNDKTGLWKLSFRITIYQREKNEVI